MARVIYTEPISELFGSIGGLTFQRNASGCIVRMKPKQNVNPTPLQLQYEHRVAAIAARWQIMGDADRTDWDGFATDHLHVDGWGNSHKLNSFQWYVSVNLYRLLTSQAISDAIPEWAIIPVMDTFTLYADIDELKLDFGSGYSPQPYIYEVLASAPMSQDSLKMRRAFRYMGLYSPSSSRYIDITAAYATYFGLQWGQFFVDNISTIIVRANFIQYASGLAGPHYTARLRLSF